jgi:ankyrin repeat protein
MKPNRIKKSANITRAVVASLTLSAGSLQAVEMARLAELAERGDWSALNTVVAEGGDVNVAQIDGMTALHWAVWQDETNVVQTLLESGASAVATNRYDVSPLSIACENGNGEIVAMLLKAGADANATLAGGETALITAARTGKIEAVRALIAHGAEIDAKQRKAQTALHWAAHEGHADVVQLLISMGADQHRRLNSGLNPWLLAARQGHAEVMRVLLQEGQDVTEAVPKVGDGKGGIKPGTSAMLMALKNGHFELALELVEAGADPNDLRTGLAPLHILPEVMNPHNGDGPDGQPAPRGSGKLSPLQFIERLVEAGADINLPVPEGRKPGRGNIHMQGVTPFFQAARRDDVPMMKLMLELGADPTLANVENCTPLLAAAGVGILTPDEDVGTPEQAIEAINLLLELGADINAVDDNGETAMHGTAYKNVPTVSAFLAENGADISIWNTKNRHGWTPMLIAEGYRPGNFKPSAETAAGIATIITRAGFALDDGPKPEIGDNY